VHYAPAAAAKLSIGLAFSIIYGKVVMAIFGFGRRVEAAMGAEIAALA
jgi:hypothetical protein